MDDCFLDEIRNFGLIIPPMLLMIFMAGRKDNPQGGRGWGDKPAFSTQEKESDLIDSNWKGRNGQCLSLRHVAASSCAWQGLRGIQT